ncbi:Conserved_hypothetical protein [Hexamita inflata]|uniref:Leucine Rich Repeat family protein n=1 Tax=Hexamita inflata TaxID=28002 RepID=A0ABP1H1D3_9EUKA
MENDTIRILIEQIYESKCMELRIENQDVLRARFVATICAKIPQGILDLSNQQLRASTMPYVVQLIQQLGNSVYSLILDNNPIMDEGCMVLLDAYADLQFYRYISLVSIGLNPDGTINFLRPFCKSKLETLRLGSNPSAERRNRFADDSCKFLGQFLGSCKTLKTIDFSNSQLRSMNGYLLFKNINEDTNLENVILTNTGVNNQAVVQLCSQKAQYFNYIQSLDLSGNQTLNDECAPHIAQFIQFQRRFHSLNLSGCDQITLGLNPIFQALQYKSADKLAAQEEKEKRDAVRTQERTQKLMSLGQGVQNLLLHDRVVLKGEQREKKEQEAPKQNKEEYTTALRYFNISGIKLTPVNLMHLARAMETNESLETLILEDCGIDFLKEDFTESIKLLMRNLSSIKTLKNLSLAKNALLERTVDCVQFLMENESLESLDFSFCRIGDQTLTKIAQGMQSCKSLKKLLLQGNNCENDGATALLQAIQKYQKLQQLDVNLNKIKFQLSEKLAAVVKQNVEQSCADVFNQLQDEHNRLQKEVAILQRTQLELKENYSQETQLVEEIHVKANSLLEANQAFEQQLEELRVQNDKLNRQQTIFEGEQQKINQQNNEIQQKIDTEQQVYDNKKKQIKEKQNALNVKVMELENSLKELNEDKELQTLNKELEKKKKEKENAEKEAVAVLAQLAAIEAVLIKEGIIQVVAAKK